MREVVDGLQEIPLGGQEPIQAAMVDLSAVSVVAGERDLPVGALRRLSFAAEIPALNVLRSFGADSWTEAAGVEPGQVRTVSGVGRTVTIWRFDTPARQAEVVAHMSARGFQPAGADALEDSGKGFSLRVL